MNNTVFIGIDPTAGRRPMNYAVLDGTLHALVLEATGGLPEVVSAVEGYPEAVVAVDAPQSLNSGLMASAEYRARLDPLPAPGRWNGYRVCEYLLKKRGIDLYSTPAEISAAAIWMQVGFEIYDRLRSASFETHRPGSQAARQMLEVHPYACFTVLLGHRPTPKNSLEGRLQRQLVLFRAGVAVPDPMESLEELTAHHLLAGTMELPGLLSHDALDALAAAYTACLAVTAPDMVTLVGDPEEGQIVLPVAPGELKAQYAKSSA